jgi:hypothetical protein
MNANRKEMLGPVQFRWNLRALASIRGYIHG